MQGEDPVLDHQMGTLKCNRKVGGEREREREREREHLHGEGATERAALFT
jgi:hypothetical protein